MVVDWEWWSSGVGVNAFDCILIEKLKTGIGFSLKACKLVRSYINNRMSTVFSYNRSSLINFSRVRQGSNLGPLRFSLNIEDLDLQFSEMTTLLCCRRFPEFHLTSIILFLTFVSTSTKTRIWSYLFKSIHHNNLAKTNMLAARDTLISGWFNTEVINNFQHTITSNKISLLHTRTRVQTRL